MSTSVALSPVAVLQFLDNAGNLCVGGTLTTQVGGINYPTYSEPTGTTALPNPIPLNSRGEVSTAAGTSSPLYLQTGVSYTLILKDSAGNQLWSISNVVSQNGQAVSFPTASGTANAQVVTNAAPISFGNGVIQWFFPVSANTGPATLNVDNTGAKNIYWNGTALVGAELQPTVPAQVISDGTRWNLITACRQDSAIAISGTSTLTGTASGVTGYYDGLRIRGKMASTTTGTPTLNINSLGALNIYYMDGTTQSVPGANIQNVIYDWIYDSSLNSSAGGWLCVNPSRSTGSFTGTPTGFSGSPGTCTVTYSVGPDGHSVNMIISNGISGTSNATTFTITGMPLALTPANQQSFIVFATNAGATVTVCLAVGATSQVISLGATSTYAGFTGWTASGTKAFPSGGTGVTIQYQI